MIGILRTTNIQMNVGASIGGSYSPEWGLNRGVGRRPLWPAAQADP